jgi:hypothetical protein
MVLGRAGSSSSTRVSIRLQREAYWGQGPILILITLGLVFGLPRSGTHVTKRGLLNLDYAGITFLSASLCFLLLSLTASKFLLWAFMSSILCLFAFIGVEARVAAEPIVPVALLRYPPLLYSCVATTLTMTARWIILFYTPVYTIAVLGWTATEAGASLIPSSLGFVLGSLVIGHFGVRKHSSFYW